jgi:hypothetical protein
MCPVCWWEDDGQDEKGAAVVRGGRNATLSLRAAQYRSVHAPRPEL